MNKMSKIKFVFIVLILLSIQGLEAQVKRPLQHSDYDGWESISNEAINKNGQWVGSLINPQEGDGRLELVSIKSASQKIILHRVKNWKFSPDGNYAIGHVTPQNDLIKSQKLKKVKKEDLPKDSLFIVQLNTQKIEKISLLKSYEIPSKASPWIGFLLEQDNKLPAKETTKSDSTQVESKPQRPAPKTEGNLLVIRTWLEDKKHEFERVTSFGFSEEGTHVYYVQAGKDKKENPSFFLLDLKTGQSKLIDDQHKVISSVAFSGNLKNLAYLASADSVKAKTPYYSLRILDLDKGTTSEIVSKMTLKNGNTGRVSQNGRVLFSEDNQKLFFGLSEDYKKFTYEEDSTLLDEDRVSLDIWGWQDLEIQPMQLKNLNREKQKSYLTVYSLKDKKITQIGDEVLENINLGRKVKHSQLVAVDDKPYRINSSWDTQSGRDVYLVNLDNGSKKLIQKAVVGFPQLSPSGKFVYWYDNKDSAWVSYEVVTGKINNLTKSLGVNFYDEIHDSPSLPSSYGAAGWLAEDAGFLVYDKFDIWRVDASGKQKPINVTLGEGRKQSIQFRRERLDDEEEGISVSEPLFLSAFHDLDKRSGFFLGDVKGVTTPKSLMLSTHRYFGIKKAKDINQYIVKKSTFEEGEDLYAFDLNQLQLQKLTSINPQRSEINWGTVEMVNYLANDGVPLQGLLFKPENFDASKKYPMIVYFYERNSDGLYSSRNPAPSASTINIPYFVSNEYLVFVPDIKYDLGLPGPSAYNCIIPGVQVLLARGYVDKDNMAIQGQSWGGYQVAYLITQTNLFKAAGAGAPVVNMTSAYGGIRWGTGMSRMFQYEQTQSRIGGTLWEKPLYYLENSPLFFMDRVNTPVLIMHNDEDGAVPWYQGIEMFMALKRLGKPAWLLQYNKEDHNLVLRKNRKDLSIRLSQFFDHYLKGAPAPLWMTEGLPAIEKGRTLKYELPQ
jgi:dipeptidyl aminopeptidase/acylaminoacyl peptidase